MPDYFVEGVWGHLRAQLAHLVALSGDIGSLSVLPFTPLPDAERHTVLQEWNRTDVAYPQDRTLHQQFEAQAAATPGNIALVFEGESLTYAALNDRANRLAHVIRGEYRSRHQSEMGPDTLIGLYLERSLEMVVSILAVLKAGGAYVPVSPEYPAERTAFILGDTQAPLVLTQSGLEPGLAAACAGLASSPGLLAVDSLSPEAGEAENPGVAVSPSDLAYVIYTSGTTGQPKGVMIEHQQACHLVTAQIECFAATYYQRALQFASYVFDASVSELFVSLLSGQEVILCPDSVRSDPAALSQLLSEHHIELATLPPAVLSQMLEVGVGPVKTLVTAGETPGQEVLEQFSLGRLLINAYGPTEATVCASAHRVMAGDSARNIGRPLSNTRLYVLDNRGNPAPVGVPGELYIGGAGLARGYLNRPGLTAERFVANPFATEADRARGYTRLYRTGDLVRWLPDGNLEYLGRNDFQVKIRGYRIELGEIEQALLGQPGVRQAVVIDREREGGRYLAAYVVCRDGEPLSAEGLRQGLSSRLPEYMVPASFTAIEAVPLTLNGKLDRRALPEPVWGDAEGYVAPGSELESQLCGIWQSVLGLERVGIHDNFFRVGGNSISAIRLAAALRRELGRELPLARLFALKTVAALADELAAADGAGLLVIPRAEVSRIPLSFAQERLLFVEQFEQGTDAYHIPYLAELSADADLAVLGRAIGAVVARHPVLNSVYLSDGATGESYQQVLERAPAIETREVGSEPALLAALQATLSRPFELAAEAPLRLRHYRQGDRQYLLLLWHHIAFDGWSLEVFLEELGSAYEAYSRGREPALPALDIGYADYAVWQRDYLQGEVLEQQLDYWQRALSGYETLALPADHARPGQVDYRGRDHGFTLDAALSAQLRELARSQETTLYTVLLSAFYVTLAGLSGQEDIVVGTPSDNRHHAQTQPLVGFFANSLALRAEVRPDTAVAGLIGQVHEVVAGAKAHQELPFERLVEALDVARDPARHPLFQVMFGMQSFGSRVGASAGLPFAPAALAGGEALYTPAKFDLSLFVDDGQAALTGSLNYAVGLFGAETAARMVALYRRVLAAFVADPGRELGSIELLSAAERHTVLQEWNRTDVAYPQDRTLHQQFEAQAAATPGNIALVFEGESLTYAALNDRANRLAHVIRGEYRSRHQSEMGPDTLIGLYLERSLEMVVSILAVLKAGGAYVPVSPEYPAERTAFILGDTQAPLVLTQSGLEPGLAAACAGLASSPGLLAVDSLSPEAGEAENPGVAVSPSDLAYVIYTSGTTGQPKGVMMPHLGYADFIHQYRRSLSSGAISSLSITNYTFDIFGLEYGVPLVSGGTLYLSDIHKASAELSDYGAHIDVVQLTPSVWELLLGSLSEALPLGHVTALVGGESGAPALFTQLAERFGRVVQVYGPTESCIWSVHSTYQPGQNVAVIGAPLPNEHCYVLSEKGLASPIGAPGELYIGGRAWRVAT